MNEYKVPEGKKIRIAISGKSGCGNTTVSTLLAKKIGIKLINYTFRQLAEEEGLTLSEIIEKAKNDDSFDIKIDTKQVDMAMQDSCVLSSRLAIWMLKEADLKVYLYANEEQRANRIFNREGGDIEQIKTFTAMRDQEDTNRYERIYKINNNNYDFVDLFIDTGPYNPDEIVEIIIKKLVEKNLLWRNKMVNYSGKAFFCGDDSFTKSDIIGTRFVIAKTLCDDAATNAEGSNLLGFIFSNCSQEKKAELYAKGFLGIDLDKKNAEDMFRIFKDKDTDCSVIINEDGISKVKLISGSLSKSYPFKLNDLDKKLIENPSWRGNK